MRETTLVGSLLALSILASGPVALAKDKAAPTTRGTVERVEKSRLTLKDAEGKPLSFALDEKTVALRGDKAVPVASLKAGERVTIESRTAAGVSTAVKIRVGAEARAARYSCPMHPEVVSDTPGKCPKCGMFLEQAKP